MNYLITNGKKVIGNGRFYRSTVFVFLVILYLLLFFNDVFAVTFTSSDLEGTWRYHGLISGDSPGQTPGWYWGTHTVDSTGNVTSSSVVTDSLGNSNVTPGGISILINASGFISVNQILSGYMNVNKDMMVLVGTMCPGSDTAVCGYNLLIMIKDQSASFTTSDFEGIWGIHGLTSGDSPQFTGWAYGTVPLDSAGSGTMSLTNSTGASYSTSVTFTITNDGLIGPTPGRHGVMNNSKDFIVFVADDGGGGYTLMVLNKRSSTTFRPSDLSGNWHMHGLVSGDDPQWTGWGIGMFNMVNNNFIDFHVNSDGNPLSLNGTFSFSATGIISGVGPYGNIHGAMNADKNLIAITMPDGGSGHGLLIMLRNNVPQPTCDINNDGVTGLEEAIHALQVVAVVRDKACNSNTDCPSTGYCEKNEGECNSIGQCSAKPDACYDLWDPVCGCDSRTYGNACEAAAAGVSISYTGECTLTCSTNSDCQQGAYCSKSDGDCDGTGVCQEMPQACPDVWSPVCGCDSRTYGNACEAAAAGVSVVSSGECRNSQCDDGTIVLCLMPQPICGSHEILAIQDNCWVCVNELTCRPWGEPGCGPDAGCPAGQSCDPCGTSSCPVCDDCVPACVPDTL